MVKFESCFIVSTDLTLLVLTLGFTFCINPVWEAQDWGTLTFLDLRLPHNLRPPQQGIGRNPDCRADEAL
jgi:hypothetical protein